MYVVIQNGIGLEANQLEQITPNLCYLVCVLRDPFKKVFEFLFWLLQHCR